MAENDFQLPASQRGEVLPAELSNEYFRNLDAALARAEARQLERTLGELGDRGFLRSGETFTRVAEDILGPSQERRRQAIIPLVQEGSLLGREERLGETQFQRQRQFASEEQERRLVQMEKSAQIQRMLLELENDLKGGDVWGGILGQVTGAAAGGLFGGVGGGVGYGLASKIAGGMRTQKPWYEQ